MEDNGHSELKKMAHADLSWLGGIFDGEGCIGGWLVERKEGGYKLVIQASISNTDAKIIDECIKISNNNDFSPSNTTWRSPESVSVRAKKPKGEIWWYGQKKLYELCTKLVLFLKGEKNMKMRHMINFIEDRMQKEHYHQPQNLIMLEKILGNGKTQRERFEEVKGRGGRLYNAR